MLEKSPSSVRVSFIAVAFSLAIASRHLYSFLPEPFATLTWKAGWVLVCVAGVMLMERTSLGIALSKLGMKKPALLPAMVAVVSSAPMLVVFAITLTVNRETPLLNLISVALVAPLTEETLFRGFLFQQLRRFAGVSVRASFWISSLAFGLAHLTTLADLPGSMTDLFLSIGMISAGGFLFAWLFSRWDDDLWVPILLHAAMNLNCELFACDRSLMSSPLTLARLSAVAAAIVLTITKSRWKSIKESPGE